MQQAIPYRNRAPTSSPPAFALDGRSVREQVAEKAVVVFARRGCCMCHVMKLLLHGHGVYPSIFHVDDHNEAEVNEELSKIIGAAAPQLPAVFLAGELFGGIEKIMGAHISGELVPRLREARALWL
ncbi:glutaredoxin-C9-like [Salvia splendens]|uniref:glutaredoxin-C9-like n=1 Tax=Salvia splendens TaxID=180675 RepID=UPI001C256E6D|nr:glutaredoxin-C9-like [Salvia splendens]